MQQAWQSLDGKESISTVLLSHPYVSAPVGMESDNQFLNAVGILETDLGAEDLLVVLQQVEREFGRGAKSAEIGYQDRLLDLDLLYYGEKILASAHLVLPHPHIADRLFVLAPLAEIDPKHPSPLTGLTAEFMYHDLLQRIASGEENVQEIQRGEWT